jgi:ribosome maturation factor RimP
MNGGDQVVIKNDISHAISTYLETENLELYDLNIAGNESISKVEIFIFSHEDQELSTFERLNYQIQRLLEDTGLEKGTYELILSSPGVERSLKTKRHYELALNEEIKINLINPKNGEYTFIGNLVNINEKDVEILNDGLTYNFEYENIKKANIRFNKFRQKVKN